MIGVKSPFILLRVLTNFKVLLSLVKIKRGGEIRITGRVTGRIRSVRHLFPILSRVLHLGSRLERIDLNPSSTMVNKKII